MRNLTDANDDDLIFMMDALDVWLQQSPEALIRRYEELEEDVVIGVDKACWPNEWDGVKFLFRLLVSSLTECHCTSLFAKVFQNHLFPWARLGTIQRSLGSMDLIGNVHLLFQNQLK